CGADPGTRRPMKACWSLSMVTPHKSLPARATRSAPTGGRRDSTRIAVEKLSIERLALSASCRPSHIGTSTKIQIATMPSTMRLLIDCPTGAATCGAYSRTVTLDRSDGCDEHIDGVSAL